MAHFFSWLAFCSMTQSVPTMGQTSFRQPWCIFSFTSSNPSIGGTDVSLFGIFSVDRLLLAPNKVCTPRKNHHLSGLTAVDDMCCSSLNAAVRGCARFALYISKPGNMYYSTQIMRILLARPATPARSYKLGSTSGSKYLDLEVCLICDLY